MKNKIIFYAISFLLALCIKPVVGFMTEARDCKFELENFKQAEIIDDERAGDGVRLDMDDSMFVVRYSQNGPYLTIKFEALNQKKYEFDKIISVKLNPIVLNVRPLSIIQYPVIAKFIVGFNSFHFFCATISDVTAAVISLLFPLTHFLGKK